MGSSGSWRRPCVGAEAPKQHGVCVWWGERGGAVFSAMPLPMRSRMGVPSAESPKSVAQLEQRMPANKKKGCGQPRRTMAAWGRCVVVWVGWWFGSWGRQAGRHIGHGLAWSGLGWRSWLGPVWSGLVLRVVVWHGLAEPGLGWPGMACHGMPWHGVAWHA